MSHTKVCLIDNDERAHIVNHLRHGSS